MLQQYAEEVSIHWNYWNGSSPFVTSAINLSYIVAVAVKHEYKKYRAVKHEWVWKKNTKSIIQSIYIFDITLNNTRKKKPLYSKM